ncbi:unnamed protein product [Medioppia subpectinata]|uniref:protein-tyrosine-phosphatase n=1 Tax=Medioppia subpectinata TaxID=1979941 RepID=A0A7R9KEI5_9ACAR|nr:unnamed protein product [Medioppia subpectinata]CAG2101924.1 unnamed protein product [Medioppia subpectinata]
MPFRLRLGKRSQQYNVSNKDLYVIAIEIVTTESIECTLFSTSIGRECLSNVCQRLNIQSEHLFGLLFKSKRGFHQWVDLVKPLKKQLDKYSQESRLYLRLQYFVPNVHFLPDEVSRYHYFYSLKQLVIEGRLHCDREEAILLASFSLQAEFGDFNPERHDVQYLKTFGLFPRSMVTNNRVAQDLQLESVINAYRKLQGVPPNAAEIYYIHEAQQLNGIGLEGFPVNDSGADVCLGVTLRGIFVVDTNGSKEMFDWNSIKNLVHQKKVFTIERNPDGLRKNYSTFDSDYASCVWRTCVEQHQYFMKGLRNSVDTESQQSDQSRQEVVSNANSNTNGTISLDQKHNNSNHMSGSTEIMHNQILSASALPHSIQIGEQNQYSNESVNNLNTSADILERNSQYSGGNYSNRDLTSDMISTQLHTNSETNIFGVRTSADSTDLHQIHVTFPDKNELSVQESTDIHTSVSNVSNITRVQVHHQPSWSDHHRQQCEPSDLTYEQRKQLLPPYMPPPDYQTFMSQKYSNLGVSAGNIGSRSSHPMTNYGSNGFLMSSASTSASSVRHLCPQPPYPQYKNYSDLSNLELDQLSNGLNNKCAVRSSLPVTQNWLQSEQPMIASPLRFHQLSSGVITCSTPELNSLNILHSNENILREKSVQHNHHLLYLINNQKLPPPYAFNSVPDLSVQPLVASQLIQNIIEPIVTVPNNHDNRPRREATSGSEPNIANIPLMTAFSTSVNPIPHLNSSVDQLLQSQGLHASSVSNGLPNVHLRQSSNLQNVYNLSQRQQHSLITTHNNCVKPTEVITRVSTQHNSANSSQNTIENRNSNNSEIMSTIGSYLVKKKDNNDSIHSTNDSNKDRRVFALEETVNDPEFIREFDLLPRMNPTAKFTTALTPDNIYRNRFRDILPYEDNRVKLTPTKDNKSGYINASHVVMHLGNTRNHYIASQGPLASTAVDFWQMIYEYSVNLIVMVTNLYELNQQKCFEYFPQTHEPPNNVLRFGDYEKRNVTHLRFTEWNDHSCPDDVHGFLAFLSEMDAIHRRFSREGSGLGRKRNQTIAPIVVHCSADFNSTEILDVPKALTQLRFQRMLSVQHSLQFRFVCKVLAQYLANSRLI